MYKETLPKEANNELALKLKGFDVNERKLDLDKFWRKLPNGKLVQNQVLDDLYGNHLEYKEYVIRSLIELSRRGESYHGMELGMKKYFELMQTLQPAFLHVR